MNYLATYDYVVIALYLSVLVGLGLYLRKWASRSLEDYFLGGKRLPWWAMGVSGMASYTDMAGTMLIVSFLYMLGPRGIYVEFRGGAVLILPFMLLWTGKWHYRSRCMTGAEWMEYRFGKSWGGQLARLILAFGVIVTTVGMLAYMIKALGMFVSMFLPFSPVQCAMVMIGVATLYTIVSGFYGVVYTDLFQSVIVISAIVVITVLAAAHITDRYSLANLARAVTGDENWMSSTLPWKTSMPKGYEAYQHLALFAFFYFLRNALIGMSSAGADPKYFGARNERECGTLTFLWTSLMMFRWPMMIGLAVLGLLLVNGLFPDQAVLAQAAVLIKTHVPGSPKEHWADLLAELRNSPEHFSPVLIDGLKGIFHGDWQSKLHLLSFEGTVNTERIVPAVILLLLPTGLRGFLLIAFVAAALSSFNASINMTSGYFTRDIYQRHLRPAAQNVELIGATYVFTVVLVIIGFVLAYNVESINQIWGWIIMALGGGLAVPSFLKFYWWRYNGEGFAIGTIVGIGGAVLINWVVPGLVEWEQFLAIAAVSLVATVAGTLLTPPAEDSVVAHFYETTRPFGAWKPYKQRLAAAFRTTMEREHRNDLLALPFTLCWHVTLFLLPMQLVIRSYGDIPTTLVVFLVSLAGMYWFWYRNLPAAQPAAVAS
ncbi:MAG: sodium:solute symporter [Bacteroidota bacterium]